MFSAHISLANHDYTCYFKIIYRIRWIKLCSRQGNCFSVCFVGVVDILHRDARSSYSFTFHRSLYSLYARGYKNHAQSTILDGLFCRLAYCEPAVTQSETYKYQLITVGIFLIIVHLTQCIARLIKSHTAQKRVTVSFRIQRIYSRQNLIDESHLRILILEIAH